MANGYDPRVTCSACWEAERRRRSEEDFRRYGEIVVASLAPQEPVWIDSQGDIFCQNHVGRSFFRRLDSVFANEACSMCGGGPIKMDLDIPGLLPGLRK